MGTTDVHLPTQLIITIAGMLLSGLLGYGGAMLKIGRRLQKFEQIESDVSKISGDVSQIKESELISRTEFNNEVKDLHDRISKNSEKMEHSMTDLNNKLYVISNQMSRVEGYLFRDKEREPNKA